MSFEDGILGLDSQQELHPDAQMISTSMPNLLDLSSTVLDIDDGVLPREAEVSMDDIAYEMAAIEPSVNEEQPRAEMPQIFQNNNVDSSFEESAQEFTEVVGVDDSTYAMMLENEAMEVPPPLVELDEEQSEEMAEVAEQLAEIDPAAGDDSQGGLDSDGGYGYQSEFDAQGVIPVDDVGPLGETELQYGVEPPKPEIFTLSQKQGETAPDTQPPPNDVPEIFNAFNKVDESDMSPTTTVSGTLNADFGQDGIGGFSGNGVIASRDMTSNGAPLEISFNVATNTYVGVAGGETIFTLTIQSDGTYNFDLVGTLDHFNPNDPNDAMYIQFGITATDADGDSADGTLTIKVLDDGPVAEDDCVSFELNDNSIDGNVLHNDDLSQDQGNVVTQVSFEGLVVNVPDSGTVSIAGKNGILEISADGSYTYTLHDGAGVAISSSSLDPAQLDVAGVQDSLTKDGITISVANDGNYDLTWVNTHDGSGIGIDNLDSNDSHKVWPKGETFDISFAQSADSVTLTIAEIGSNNNQGHHGVDFVITLSDGSTVTGEQQFVPGQIIDGVFSFTLNASDYGGLEIVSIALNSTNEGAYQGASFLLNNVSATYDSHTDIQDQFEYIISDADGDTSSATLKLNGLASEIVVAHTDAVDDAKVLEPEFVPQIFAAAASSKDINTKGDVIKGTNEDDVLRGDDADNVIYGEAGEDVLYGGGGNDILSGGDDADRFMFEAIGQGIDVIRDFSPNEGDVLDFAGLIKNYDPTQQAIDDFVFARQVHGGTILSVDAGGSGDASNAVDLVALEGLETSDIQAMLEDGSINVF